MFALILRHKASVGITPVGIIILHETHEPVLMGDTPLSKVLLRDYSQGFRFFVYDRPTNTRKEKIVTAKNLDMFLKTGSSYYAYANMSIERMPYSDDDPRTINIDNTVYALGEIKK